MIIFCFIKYLIGAYLSNDFFVVSTFIIQLLDVKVCSFFLVVVVVKNCGSILRTYVGPLTVQLCWIMGNKERRKQFIVRDLSGIVNDITSLGMPSSAGGYLSIGWIADMATRIARYNENNTFYLFELFLHTPEAAGGKRGGISRLVNDLRIYSI